MTWTYRLDGLNVQAPVVLPPEDIDAPPDWKVVFTNMDFEFDGISETGEASDGLVVWARFGRLGAKRVVRLAGVLDLVAEPTSKTAAIRACRPDLAELYRLRRAMPYLVHLAGGVALHAACVVVRGRTWLLCGDTGAGKSTLALAFDAAGHPVLADDHVALTFTDDGRLQAEASFPRVDAMPDAVAALRPDCEAGEAKQSVPLRTVRPARARIDRIAFLARGTELLRTPLPAPEVATRLLRDVLFVGDPASGAEQTRRLDVAALLAEHVPAHAVSIPTASTAEDWTRVIAAGIWD